ncbi:MAG: aminodeoxychorismate/anthranilate synthase component II [Ignavibacteriales bacterium]|nr:MAG: aminodeoxychorismate/anthranilate synthase component II [Ignavibacteriales bacterium]
MNSKILIIDNYDSFTFNLKQIVKEFHYDYTIIKNDELTLDEIDKFSKILISPGPGIPEQAGLVKEVIKQFASSKSILGICLGYQAIAEVFGGKLYNFSDVCHGISTNVKVIDSDDYLFSSIPQNFDAGLYHSWAVSKKYFPDCLKITSISEGDVIMSLSHIKYDVKGVQFHPESIMTKHGKQIINNWLNH